MLISSSLEQWHVTLQRNEKMTRHYQHIQHAFLWRWSDVKMQSGNNRVDIFVAIVTNITIKQLNYTFFKKNTPLTAIIVAHIFFMQNQFLAFSQMLCSAFFLTFHRFVQLMRHLTWNFWSNSSLCSSSGLRLADCPSHSITENCLFPL